MSPTQLGVAVVIYVYLVGFGIVYRIVRDEPEQRPGERGIHYIGRLFVLGHFQWVYICGGLSGWLLRRAAAVGAYLVRPKQPDNGGSDQ